MIRLFFISSIFLLLAGFSAFCQTDQAGSSDSALIIKKFSQSIVFDGVPDEEAWKEINPVKLTMHAPVFGREPSEKTDVRIAYDDKYMYAGAILYYKDPVVDENGEFKKRLYGGRNRLVWSSFRYLQR